MKRLLLICLVFLGVALTVKANGEPDFASKYLMLYGQTYDIDCKTISPQMMERILSGVAGSEDENTMRVLSQIKSIRILTTEPNACQAKTLFEKAEEPVCLPPPWHGHAPVWPVQTKTPRNSIAPQPCFHSLA